MKLIPQERLDAAKGHTPGPWFVHPGPCYPEIRKQFNASHHMTMCNAIHGHMYSGSQSEQQQANAELLALAPELLAENEILRALLTEAMNVNADITTHAHHLHSTGLLWRAEKIKELADALSDKLDEVLP